ncbi:hypothetical protein C8Z91_03105 [Paenibacillus elgii]|uniref:Uncharacterized protein n=1 Tax=Paenibacillus elgii TaxID=189691 RepID=A0A2T6G910_9BACL|nr:hypothetical protein [Paenibacillus elgii]PUA40646.1 hypothetical protein C8Z91_03105 [Paenibacillus elgii]
MSILLKVERESGGQPIELGNGQITGYSYTNTSPADFLAKAYNVVHSIQIRGEIPLRLLPPVEQDADNSNTLYAWALTEYRPDNDYYRSVTVRVIRHEKAIREFVFTHAYIHGYNEKVNGLKGTLEFELILRQKRDQLDSIRCSLGESTIQDLSKKKEKRVSLLAYSGSTPFDNSSMNVLKDAVLGTLNNTKDWVTEKADQIRGINSTISELDSGYKMLIGDDINTLLDPNLAPKEKAQELVGIPVFGKLGKWGNGRFLGSIIKDGNNIKYTNLSGNVLSWGEQHPKNIKRDIENTKDSKDVGKATESKVAAFVKETKEVTGYAQGIKKADNSPAGDLDVVTNDEIIEVKKSLKAVTDVGQFDKYVDETHPDFFNPGQKRVILYIDTELTNLHPNDIKKLDVIKSKGIIIVNSLDELKEVIK